MHHDYYRPAWQRPQGNPTVLLAGMFIIKLAQRIPICENKACIRKGQAMFLDVDSLLSMSKSNLIGLRLVDGVCLNRS
jgi:hypothetical protein